MTAAARPSAHNLGDVPGGLMDSLADRLTEVALRYRLSALYLFGSRAQEVAARVRGDMAPSGPAASDVDVAVEPLAGSHLTAQDRVRLTIELEDLIEAPRVDLVVLSEADPFLALEVIRGEVLYCADPDAQAEEELYVLRRAADLAPYERMRRRLLLGTPG